MRGERPSRRWVIATLLGIIGCALLVAVGEKINIDPFGIFLAICAGGSYAVFTTVSKGLIETHSPESVMAVTFCLGACFVLPLLVQGQPGLAEGAGRVAGDAAPGGDHCRIGLYPVRTRAAPGAGGYRRQPHPGRAADCRDCWAWYSCMKH